MNAICHNVVLNANIPKSMLSLEPLDQNTHLFVLILMAVWSYVMTSAVLTIEQLVLWMWIPNGHLNAQKYFKMYVKKKICHICSQHT